MSSTIPTSNEIYEFAVSYYETALGQDAPITPKAFLRILAQVQKFLIIGLYKLAAERYLQNLVLSATSDDLKKLGSEYGIEYQDAVPAQLVLTCTGTNGTDIPARTVFIGDSNGLLYYTQALVTIAGGTATPTVTCYTAGVDSQLEVSDTLTLSSPITGIDNSAVVASISVDGVDAQDEEVYRRQVHDEIQTTGGGSNSADFRNWGQEVTNITRLFPYAGTPIRQSVEFVDWDMEESGVTNWSTTNSPTLTKETGTPHEGTQVLRITRGATAYPSAYQTCLKMYNKYTIIGWARSDGNCIPDLRCGNHVLWTGTTSTSWQEIDVTILVGEDSNDTTDLRLLCGSGASSQYVEFDDFEILQTEYPGHVTVYCECDTSVQADGIPTTALLDDVRDYITTDQDTGIDRPSLGIVDDNLFVEPIIRTSIYLEIRGLDIASELETQAKADLDTDVDAYLRNATPYIQGVDSQSSQADQITDPLISKVVQDVLDSYGATCSGIGIGIQVGVFLASYSLGAGELAKLGSIIYV